MIKFCFCGKTIEQDRLEAIPSTKYCIECARTCVSTKKAYMVYSHKTAPELVLVDTNDREAIRLADRAFKRKR